MMNGAMLAHSVYFSLHDKSDDAKKRLVASCKTYLADHPGTVFFAAGTRAEDLDWPISDREFDLALHIFFESKAAHDEYQDSPRHIQFLDENSALWKDVRVFDAYIER